MTLIEEMAAGLQPIETAPKNTRIVVWTGQEFYAAHWAKNPFTDDEAWIVAAWGDDGDQALVKPTHWCPAASSAIKDAIGKFGENWEDSGVEDVAD